MAVGLCAAVDSRRGDAILIYTVRNAALIKGGVGAKSLTPLLGPI